MKVFLRGLLKSPKEFHINGSDVPLFKPNIRKGDCVTIDTGLVVKCYEANQDIQSSFL